MRNDQDLMDKVDDLKYHLTQIDPVQFKDRKCARNLLLALATFIEVENNDYENNPAKKRGLSCI